MLLSAQARITKHGYTIWQIKNKQFRHMKQKYDSSVVFLYAIGKENLLPENFRKQIPYSTISTW